MKEPDFTRPILDRKDLGPCSPEGVYKYGDDSCFFIHTPGCPDVLEEQLQQLQVLLRRLQVSSTGTFLLPSCWQSDGAGSMWVGYKLPHGWEQVFSLHELIEVGLHDPESLLSDTGPHQQMTPSGKLVLVQLVQLLSELRDCKVLATNLDSRHILVAFHNEKYHLMFAPGLGTYSASDDLKLCTSELASDLCSQLQTGYEGVSCLVTELVHLKPGLGHVLSCATHVAQAGLLIYLLFTGVHPSGSHDRSVQDAWAHTMSHELLSHIRCDELQVLVRDMLHSQPEQRPKLEHVASYFYL